MKSMTLRIVAMGLMAAGVMVYAGCRATRPGAPLQDSLSQMTPRQQVGERMFMRNCYQCHPGGNAGLAPSLNTKPLTHSMIKLQVRQGGGAMPSFGPEKISDPELVALVDYMDRLRGRTMPR